MVAGGKLRFGMVGGGEGAFIGQVHRMAAELDGLAQLVCGAFSADEQRSIRSGQTLYALPADQCYPSYEQMFASQAALPAQQRIDFVVIATPNHLHLPVARAALAAHLNVVCDKPLGNSLADARTLRNQWSVGDLKFALTHNYTGYPMLREARQLIAGGAFGSLRRVSCDYLQGWLAQDQPDNKQASWRTDPERAGAAGCFGDIGSHADNLVNYVTQMEIDSLCADLSTFVPGRRLDDDGNVLLRFVGGAKGVISASQIAVGCENDLHLRVYGEHGGLEWRQSEANSLVVKWPDRPIEIRRTGSAGTCELAMRASRIPSGHPEGYLEAFAQVYRDFCKDLRGEAHDGYPTLDDGVRGMQFIDKVVDSSQQGGQWVSWSE